MNIIQILKETEQINKETFEIYREMIEGFTTSLKDLTEACQHPDVLQSEAYLHAKELVEEFMRNTE